MFQKYGHKVDKHEEKEELCKFGQKCNKFESEEIFKSKLIFRGNYYDQWRESRDILVDGFTMIFADLASLREAIFHADKEAEKEDELKN